MDPLTEATAAGGLAYVLKESEVIKKLFGPSAELIGNELKTVTQFCLENLKSIIRRASGRLGSSPQSGDDGKGLPPRVVAGLLTDGAFFSDELAQEYFAGVLASSRSDRPRDDRGATWMTLMKRMSTYQLRTHYIIFRVLREVFKDEPELSVLSDEHRHKMELFIPFNVFAPAMSLEPTEDKHAFAFLDHALFGLQAESLIQTFKYGKDVEYGGAPGFTVVPNMRGAELFLWAHGHGTSNVRDFLRSDLVLDMPLNIDVPAGSMSKRVAAALPKPAVVEQPGP